MTKEIPAHVQRMQQELSDLQEKIEKLEVFIEENPLFSTLEDEEQGDLREQLHYMLMYSFRLDSRIERAKFNLQDSEDRPAPSKDDECQCDWCAPSE